MARSMMRFIKDDRAMPSKRPADSRVKDFKEIYQTYGAETLADQSARCAQCGIPFCHTACPLSNNIPDWLMLAANGRMEEAWLRASETNPLPEMTGRICPQDRLCEGSCVIEQSGHGAVVIGAVEQHIAHFAFEKGWVTPIVPENDTGKSVAIIGSGPAGLAAADRLRRAGVEVTIYERQDKPGGLLQYGIPGFKLEKDIVAARVDFLTASGVDFATEVEVGKDIGFRELMRRHDAILIAAGVYKGRALALPSALGETVLPALDFLTSATKRDAGDRMQQDKFYAKGKRVVVIGGGDTAMDCLRTALRQGASSAVCLYRRDRENMPGSQREVENAIQEGAQFEWLSSPEALLEKNGHVTAVRAHRMRLGDADASGRRRPEPVSGSGFEAKADMVIAALGFMPEDFCELFDLEDLACHADGRIKTDAATMETSVKNVYAAGDAVRGASLVVWAIRDALIAADAITARLKKGE